MIKKVIAIGCLLVLLAGILFFPKGLDTAVWHYREDPKRAVIIHYDEDRPPAVGLTLNARNTEELMRMMRPLKERRTGSREPGADAPVQYVLRLRTSESDVYTPLESSEVTLIDGSGLLKATYEDASSCYRVSEETREKLFGLFDSYLYPEGGYPGRAFLEAFFTAGCSPEALAPYMTGEAQKELEQSGFLNRLQQRCRSQADSWRIIMIRIDEMPASGQYGYWADLQGEKGGETVLESFGGSYETDKDGRLTGFFIDLPE